MDDETKQTKIRILYAFHKVQVRRAFHAFRNPCNLNATIEKQPTVPFLTGIYDYNIAAVEKPSKLLWRPN